MAWTTRKGTKATAGSKRGVKDLPATDGHAVKGGMLSNVSKTPSEISANFARNVRV